VCGVTAFELTTSVVLVEGLSDEIAVRALAARRGRDLVGEGVAVVPIGGAQAIGRVLRSLGTDVRVAGLCDAGEEAAFRRALGAADRDALAARGFFVCDVDLEDELVRAVGIEAVLAVIDARGELSPFRTYQKQLAHRARPLAAQLHGFMHNRKVEYAQLLVDALDLDRVPRPLDGVLAFV